MPVRRRAQLGIDVPASTEVRRRPSLDFSVTGLVYCSMMMFMGLAAINSQANLLFGVFGLMIGILLVSGDRSAAWCFAGWTSSGCCRSSPSWVSRRQSVIGLRITKDSGRALSLTLAELDGAEAFTRQPVSYLLHAAAEIDGTGADRSHAEASRSASARSLPAFDELSIRFHQARNRTAANGFNPDLSRRSHMSIHGPEPLP